MALTNLKLLLQYKPIVITVIIGIFFAFIIFLIQNLTKYQLPEEVAKIDIIANAEPSVSVEYLKPTLTYITLATDFQINNIPENKMVPVYTYQKSNFFDDENIQKIFSYFGMTKISEINTPAQGFMIEAQSEDSKQRVTIHKTREIFTYSKDISFDNLPRFSSGTTEDQLVKISEDFVKSFPVNTGAFRFADVSYFLAPANTTFTPVTNISQANIASIRFIAKNNNINVIAKGETLSPNSFVVTLDSSLQVIKVYLEPIGEIGEEKYKVKIIDLNLNPDINVSTFKLIDTAELNPAIIPKSVLVTKGELAYYEINDLLLPVFVVNGNVQLEDIDRTLFNRSETNIKGIVDAIDRSTQ